MTESMLAARVRTMQILAIALANGVTIFLLIAVFALRSGKTLANSPWSLQDPLVLVGLLLAFSALALFVLLPRILDQQTVQMLRSANPGGAGSTGVDLEERLAAAYQTRLIVTSAVVEGIGLANAIFYFMTGSGVALVCALVCIVLLWLRIPTRGSVEGWLTRMREQIAGMS